MPSGSTTIATRFRALIAGDPTEIPDLVFAPTTDALSDGRYTVREDGQPGVCQPGASSSGAAGGKSVDDAQTCRQPAVRARSWTNLDLGPLLTLLVAIRTVSAIMRRGRARRPK
jgi:hypothetical protein